MTNYHKIDFHLQANNDPVAINFLPFGTRTLKIRIVKTGDDANAYVLRSSVLPKDFGKKRFYSFDTSGESFRLSWGGGRKTGACLQAEDVVKIGGHGLLQGCVPMTEPEAYTYLNLTHLSGAIDKTYKLILGAYLRDGDLDEPPAFTLEINLTPPAQIADGSVTRPVSHNSNAQEPLFAGTHVANYLPRWWAPAAVTYTAVPALPELSITAEKQLLTIELAGRRKPLATITDNIGMQDILGSRFFDAELYRWEDYYVLRVWFSWLESHGLRTIMDEIPDAERFDFVIDVEKQRVVYAATDVHWREMWVDGPKKSRSFLKANIGLFSPKSVGALPPVTKLIDEAKAFEEKSGSSAPRIPTDTVVPGGAEAQDEGIFEAHVPFFSNGSPESMEFVSSDVRNG